MHLSTGFSGMCVWKCVERTRYQQKTNSAK